MTTAVMSQANEPVQMLMADQNDESLSQAQSQSLLQGEQVAPSVLHSSTPIPIMSSVSTAQPMTIQFHPSQMGAMGPPIQPAGFQAPLPVSYMQNSLSDNDVMRVALKVKAILMDEIDTLVSLKVNEATNQIKNDIKGLKEENAKLRNDIDKLEKKCKTNIDDLEQYSRRSCLRIGGVKEENTENTDEIVMDIARRVNADVRPQDIDRSHRVGRPRELGPDPLRPREIIVKFSNSKARLDLLKGRTSLRRANASIFINEDLTSVRKELAYKCRVLRRANKIKKVWIYNGNVFIRQNDDQKVQISCDSDLTIYDS